MIIFKKANDTIIGCLNLQITGIKIDSKTTNIRKYTFLANTTEDTYFVKKPNNHSQLKGIIF